MATAPQAFRRRVKDRVAKERPQVSFYLETVDEDDEGNEYVVRRDDFTATSPTEEQLLLVYAQGAREDATVGDEVSALLSFFKDILPASQYKVLLKRLRDPDDLDVDLQTLDELFKWIMEQWQDFPTTPPSGSSTSQGGTGTKSTGRVRGKGSTR